MEFGADPNSEQLLKLAQRIKTFTEGTSSDSSEIVEIREHMSTANRLVFLGFHFHKLNMKLIKPEKVNGYPSGIYATTYNISKSDEEVIRKQVGGLYHTNIILNTANSPCKEFYTEFWKSLSF